MRRVKENKAESRILRRACAGLALAAALGAMLPATAFADSEIVVFADANLEAALLALPGADADASGSLTGDEMAALTGTLDLSGLMISDISGLQYLTGISGLDLSDNLIRGISALAAFSSVTVDLTGNCLDIAEGSADRAAIAVLQAAGCTVTYDPQKTRATGVSLDKGTLELYVGETAALAASVAPEDATVKTVVWSSDNGDVAYVTDGTVTAIDAGTAHISAVTLDGGFEAVCTVMVKTDCIRSSQYAVGADTISGVAKYTGIEAFKDNLQNDASEIHVYKTNGTELVSGTVGTA
jgi:hypothetical protein